ncbi:MAG: flagellar biosynthesis anti-sigma factor FlgM [Planctomycetes bacterium]|nr:flagellar biosynthesis anti-sigma factor FlgM [Planctomycetota bacterium]
MRISGYGEFQQMRKLAQKDDATQKEKSEREDRDVEAGNSSDSVLISPETRQKMKLRQASDFREAKVADVRARLEAGTLVTDDSVKSGVTKMLDNLASGQI